MHTHPKIFVLVAYNFEKMLKMRFRNIGDVYSKSCKNQTNRDRDLKYSLK